MPIHGARAGSHRTEFAMLDQAQRRDAGAKLIALARAATQAVEALLADATVAVRQRVTIDHQVVDRLLDREQRAAHGLAWLATYVESVRPVPRARSRNCSSRSGSANISPRFREAFP